MVIIKYFVRLFSLWTTLVFLVIDIVAFVISVYSQTITIPPRVYWIIAGVGFVTANIQLFAQMESKIKEYESQEANIILKLKDPYLDIYSADMGNNGLPRENWLRAGIEVHNIGEEIGSLVWEVDWKKSKLPDVFIHFNSEGVFDDFEEESHVEPRGGFGTFWRVSLVIKTADYTPEKFAEWLKNAKNYKIVMRYKTRKVGEDSKWKTLVMEGNYSKYRYLLVRDWKNRNLNKLVDIVEGG